MPRRKKLHQWLEDRELTEKPAMVLRVDNYETVPAMRGQFYPEGMVAEADKPGGKAIWPSYHDAFEAALWATKKFGHTYAVFQMITIVEPAEAPTKSTLL